MVEDIRTLQNSFQRLQNSLRKIKSKQVYQANIKQQAKDIVDVYFRNLHDSILNVTKDTSLTSDLSSKMHNLLESTHKRTTVTTYKSIISKLKTSLLKAEKLALLSSSVSVGKSHLDAIDKKIVDTLKKIIPSSALSYEQALIDMQTPQRLSWRGPATDLREALRECLDYLAPDKDVMASHEFKLEANTNGPTMKQKTIYILRQRSLSKTVMKTTKGAVDIVEQSLGSFVRSVYQRTNLSIHTPTDKKEVTRIRDLVRLVLCELLSIA